MPNNSYLQWLLRDDPWMAVFMLGGWISMLLFIRWVVRRERTSPPNLATPRVGVYLSSAGLVIGLMIGYFVASAPASRVAAVVMIGAYGFVVGGGIGAAICFPSFALRGVLIGMCILAALFAVLLRAALKNEVNFWAAFDWRTVLLHSIGFFAVCVMFSVRMLRIRPATEPAR